MHFLWSGVRQGWHLLVSGDPYLDHVIVVTLKVTAVSTIAALVVGLPIGLIIGLGRFRGRGIAQAIANIGLVMPPVLVGLVLSLLMFPASPLGRFHLLFTLRGVYLAQSLLALPIVAALTGSAVAALPNGLIDQARAFGANRPQLWGLAVREARIGIATATIAAVGSALSEVGAIVLVGGNIEGSDQTLASAALEKVDAGQFAYGVAIAIVLLGMIVLVVAALTTLQLRGAKFSGAQR
ncbi:MAG TPA: ABC transporter permease [Mycobacteriales bacterium]|jgi:tungstate transport system permease protein|nr:ABC transporter permease [Mycobacteriales bacterium]